MSMVEISHCFVCVVVVRKTGLSGLQFCSSHSFPFAVFVLERNFVFWGGRQLTLHRSKKVGWNAVFVGILGINPRGDCSRFKMALN